MTISSEKDYATPRQRMTLAEYLDFDDHTDQRYELVNGKLVAMPPESRQNDRIALWLLTQFFQFVSLRQLSVKTEILISGGRATARVPDLTVLSEELADALETTSRATVTWDMPPPLLVVEVVSPGKENEDRDYRYKRSEYAARGIAEYWIVDPTRARVLILTLVDGLYEEQAFQADECLRSQVLPEVSFTVEQVLQTAG